jgi:L-ascorbate metabolism protein UlaG (beta-lactamase superfamily)
MNIKKYAHACLLVEVREARFLLDPGSWNQLPDAENLSAILITHEHMDHYDPAQIKALLAQSPETQVITHPGLVSLLAKDGIEEAVIIEPGTSVIVDGVEIETFGTEHAVVYGSVPCRNTGFLIGKELFVPGDALHDVPTVPVRVLALPTGGPWMKISEAIDYAKAVKPKVVFPIHDAMHTEDYQRWLGAGLMTARLKEAGIEFVDMPNGAERAF